MKEITDLKTIQDIELKALQFIDSVCKEMGLRYFLAGGTLLGAVRHKGFIPWDNDVDIAMPRRDYEIFISVVEQKHTDSPYRIARIKDDNDYYYGFAKLYDSRTLLRENDMRHPMEWLGVYIDLFPIDGFGNDPCKAVALQRSACRTLSRIVNSKSKDIPVTPRAIAGRIRNYLYYGLFVGRERSMERLTHRLEQHSFDHSAYIASTWGARIEKEILPQQHFMQACEMEFEGLMLQAPIGWHEYLTAMYGDYMQLPPEEHRCPPHGITVHIKEGESI